MPVVSSPTQIKREVLSYLPVHIQRLLYNLKVEDYQQLEEIRLRCGQPLVVRIGERELAVSREGFLTTLLPQGYRVEPDDICRVIAPSAIIPCMPSRRIFAAVLSPYPEATGWDWPAR